LALLNVLVFRNFKQHSASFKFLGKRNRRQQLEILGPELHILGGKNSRELVGRKVEAFNKRL
jgi:hypothetical protein